MSERQIALKEEMKQLDQQQEGSKAPEIYLSNRKLRYKLIQEITATSLENVVNIYLEDGWQLYGNPSGNNGMYIQAMIKEK